MVKAVIPYVWLIDKVTALFGKLGRLLLAVGEFYNLNDYNQQC